MLLAALHYTVKHDKIEMKTEEHNGSRTPDNLTRNDLRAICAGTVSVPLYSADDPMTRTAMIELTPIEPDAEAVNLCRSCDQACGICGQEQKIRKTK